jgi:hypothetical protein
VCHIAETLTSLSRASRTVTAVADRRLVAAIRRVLLSKAAFTPIVTVALVAFASGCSGSQRAPTGPQNAWMLRAAVSGAADFAAQFGGATFTGGVLTITGLQSASSGRRELNLLVHGVTGAGTYDLTAGSGFAAYGESGVGVVRSWTTNSEQGSGSIVITELSDSAVVATFSFSAPADAGSEAIGSKDVAGTCSLPLSHMQ